MYDSACVCAALRVCACVFREPKCLSLDSEKGGEVGGGGRQEEGRKEEWVG